MKNSPLVCEIKDGQLVISIGINALCASVEVGLEIHHTICATIIDKEVFASEILCYLKDEDEIGTTLVHTMLDKAAELALENGCEGAEYDS